jgi:hypothetical protein
LVSRNLRKPSVQYQRTWKWGENEVIYKLLTLGATFAESAAVIDPDWQSWNGCSSACDHLAHREYCAILRPDCCPTNRAFWTVWNIAVSLEEMKASL